MWYTLIEFEKEKKMEKFILNETTYFGAGSRSVLPEEIKKRGYKKAFIVTDQALVDAGVTKKVTDILDGAKIKYKIYSKVKPNPTIKNVLDGYKACTTSKADFILAVGGGSPIDTAKGVAILMTNPERNDVVSLCGLSNTKNRSMPMIVLPTTAGTASEVTIYYVITDEKRQVKMVCVDPNCIPELAVVDGELMSTMPKSLSAATGMDALTHAVESYITKAHNTMSDAYAMQAIKMIMQYLPDAVNKKDKYAIEQMAIAQYMAGMAFSNVGLGIVHSMAHQLGAVYDVPHGVANAILLPTVMEFNGEVCADRFREILVALNVKKAEKMNDKKVVATLVEMLRKMSKEVGITISVKDTGAKQEDFEMLAQKAMEDACRPGNPRETTVQDFVDLYTKAW